MRDPFFAQLMFLIEEAVCTADADAQGRGIVLKDSQILSALTKAHGLVAGKQPKINDTSEADRILKDLIEKIADLPTTFIGIVVDESSGEIGPSAGKREWMMAIEAVMDSLSVRRSGIPGSREYLDFVKGFIGQAKGAGGRA